MDRRVYQQMEAVEDRHWWFLGRRAVIAAVLGDPTKSRDPAVNGRLARAVGAGDRAAAGGIGHPMRVLDAGCGSGGNVGLYAGWGPVLGVDTEAEALGQARRRGYRGVAVASLAALPFADDVFDLVAATDVVEHVADDAEALRELLRVTRPGGHLVLTVPAYRWLWSDSDVQLGHFRRYTRSQLVGRCRAAGAEVTRASYFNTTLLPAIAAARWVRQRRGQPMVATELEQTGPLANRLLRLPMAGEARLVGAGANLPAGVSIVCLCRKPEAPRPAE
ncbi:MAG: class I SAM-dependent methyltransferase [Acidimicrobiales bacterium]